MIVTSTGMTNEQGISFDVIPGALSQAQASALADSSARSVLHPGRRYAILLSEQRDKVAWYTCDELQETPAQECALANLQGGVYTLAVRGRTEDVPQEATA